MPNNFVYIIYLIIDHNIDKKYMAHIYKINGANELLFLFLPSPLLCEEIRISYFGQIQISFFVENEI